MRTFTLLLFIAIFLPACSDNDSLCLRGTGQIVNHSIDLETIHSIDLDIPADIIIQESNNQSIEISAQQNIIDEIIEHSFVSQGVWKIKINRNCIVSEDIRFFVSMSEVKMLTLDGSGDISSQGTFTNIDELDLEIDGSGSIDIDVTTPSKIVAQIDGSGMIKLDQGSTDNLIIKIDGSGDLEAFGLITENCDVDIDGSADVEVTVNQVLDVFIDGSGDLCYKGDPSVSSRIDGSGSVNDCN